MCTLSVKILKQMHIIFYLLPFKNLDIENVLARYLKSIDARNLLICRGMMIRLPGNIYIKICLF